MLLALSDVVLVSVFGLVAAVVGIGGSVVTANSTARTVRAGKEDDWARQDVLAARQEASARAIVEVNERAVAIGMHNGEQLDQVHTLVNSQMTAAKKEERDAVELSLTVLTELADVRRAAGQEPSPKAQALIETTTAKLDALNKIVAERERNDETARAQALASADAGKAAQLQVDAADQQHAAAQLQSDAADKQILVAEGQANVAQEQAKVADAQAAANPPVPPPDGTVPP